MKSNFARCAKQLEDREKAIRFDPKVVGSIFSSQAANQVFANCIKTPQLNQTAKPHFNGGSESYVVRAARSETYKRQDRRSTRDDFMWMVFGLSMATPSYGAPSYTI